MFSAARSQWLALATVFVFTCVGHTCRAELLAGVSKVDITDYEAGPVNDPLYAKALVLKQDETWLAIITVDAVAIGEIGRIGNDYLPKVKAAITNSCGIPPTNVLVNASHCHGVVRPDTDELTIRAVEQAAGDLTPVQIASGRGHEDRIMENRRLIMKDGREVDVRHAYSMPPDDQVVDVGPIDPEIGILRIDRSDGQPLAVVYNFACHPIQGVPGGGNTADISGFASTVIEESLGDEVTAFFLQGCGGDINPVFYKQFDHSRSAQPLGNLLGLSTVRALRKIKPRTDNRLKVLNRTLALPRSDLGPKIIELEEARDRSAASLRGTTLSMKTFLPLVVKHRLFEEFPSYYSHGYLHQKKLGRDDLAKSDAKNRLAIKAYIRNIETMERLTRMNTNLALLRKHQKQHLEAQKRDIDVELLGIRIGDFVLTTFPGELTVQIGLNLKQASPHENTFVAGYTNGYIYYAPTSKQLENMGGAQEDSDCILAPHWQKAYEDAAMAILGEL